MLKYGWRSGLGSIPRPGVTCELSFLQQISKFRLSECNEPIMNSRIFQRKVSDFHISMADDFIRKTISMNVFFPMHTYRTALWSFKRRLSSNCAFNFFAVLKGFYICAAKLDRLLENVGSQKF